MFARMQGTKWNNHNVKAYKLDTFSSLCVITGEQTRISKYIPKEKTGFRERE